MVDYRYAFIVVDLALQYVIQLGTTPTWTSTPEQGL
jgi:hypothetical protein